MCHNIQTANNESRPKMQHLVYWAVGPHRKKLNSIREASFRDQPPPFSQCFLVILLILSFVCEAIVPFPVGDSSFGRALLETLLLRLAPRSLKEMPHLRQVFRKIAKETHLNFSHESEPAASKNKQLEASLTLAFMSSFIPSSKISPHPSEICLFKPQLLCFSPSAADLNMCTAPVHLIDICYIFTVT